MHHKSLKSHLVTTFVGFLLLAMLSVAFPLFMLLQRSMVENESLKLKEAVTRVSLLLSEDDKKEIGYDLEVVEQFLERQGIDCYQIQYGPVDLQVQNDPRCSNVDLQRGLDKPLSSIPEIDYVGSEWSVFTFSHRFLRLQHQLFDEDRKTVHGTIVLLVSLRSIYQELRKYAFWVVCYGLVAIMILTGLLFLRMVVLFFKPIEELAQKTEAFSFDEILFEMSTQKNNEISRIAFSLNKMVKKIQSDNKKLEALVDALKKTNQNLEENRKEMVQAEKLAAIGKLAAGLAHEIGNPLGIIQGYVDMLAEKDLPQEDRQQFSKRVDHELSRISRLIRQLLDFSRSGAKEQISLDVPQSLSVVVHLVASQKMAQGIIFDEKISQDTEKVYGNQDLLQQVLLNCLLNAVEAVRTGSVHEPRIRISCEMIPGGSGDRFVGISITDNGPGLSEEQLRHAFDPFFTTKDVGHGTGLGLSVSYTIVESMGGTITLENCKNGGACVRIQLPVISHFC